ncbi:N-acetylmuramoyl-L-alanine amidase [Streptomyces sp. NRRL F-5008]|uniref:peptidoglycan recognition protein family protein n=1 Tax=Streptomyces antibioticus TaxID=1890 RepID=UPI00068C9BAD
MWSKVHWGVAGVVAIASLQAFLPSAHGQDRPRTPASAGARSEERAVVVTPDKRGAVLRAAATRPFSMLGVTWDDPSVRLVGTVEVRTRAADTGEWSEWRTLDSEEGQGDETAQRGGTDPLWVGLSDGAEVRVAASADDVSALPAGLQLDLIDPGQDAPAPQSARLPAAPAQGAPGTTSAPRPAIVLRAGWGADESISPAAPAYLAGGKVKAVVVHHTADSNSFTCAQAPAVLRGIYAYHVQQLGWKDIGYNFLVDPCGTIYEGRKGGVDRPVLAAHAYGFNSQTTGVAVLGTYTTAAPSEAVLSSVARLAAWKLGQYGVDPTGTTTLTAGADGTNYFRKSWKLGAQLNFSTIHGHRDGYNTLCPGDQLYAELPTIRALAASSTVKTTGEEPAPAPVPGSGD